MDVNPTPSASSVAPAASLDADQPAGTPETDELHGRILRRIIDLSEPVSPPALWAQFGSGTSVRRFSGEPSEVLSQLTLEFTEDQLLAARVTVRTRAGELELSKVLATNEAFLIRGDAAGHSAGDIVSAARQALDRRVRMARMGSGNDERKLSAADRSVRE